MRRVLFLATHGSTRSRLGPATMATEILIRHGVDLPPHRGDEVEVEGEDGAGGEEGHHDAEGV